MNIIINSVPYILIVSREYSYKTYGFGAIDSLDEYNELYEFSDQNDLIEKISDYQSRSKEDWHEDFEYKIFTNEKLSENFQELIKNATYEKVCTREKQEQEQQEIKFQKNKEEEHQRDLEQLERLKIKLGIKE